jgi:D-alanine-D-alanine ligase
MDKLAFGAAMAAAGLPVLPRQLARSVPGWRPGFAGPYIVKPRFGGSSIGIEVAADAEAVAALLRNSVHLRAGAVVEPYRADAIDVNVALRVHPAVELSAIVKPERVAGPIYGYREKYVPGEGMAAARQEVDPRLAAGVAEGIREAAVTIAELACVRGVPRIDFLVEGDELFVNEINTIPGSLAKHLWTHVPFTDLLAGMIDEARQRPTTAHWTSAGADGTALRSAGTIASKLG